MRLYHAAIFENQLFRARFFWSSVYLIEGKRNWTSAAVDETLDDLLFLVIINHYVFFAAFLNDLIATNDQFHAVYIIYSEIEINNPNFLAWIFSCLFNKIFKSHIFVRVFYIFLIFYTRLHYFCYEYEMGFICIASLSIIAVIHSVV